MDSSIRVVSRIDPRDPILVAAWPGNGQRGVRRRHVPEREPQGVEVRGDPPQRRFLQDGGPDKGRARRDPRAPQERILLLQKQSRRPRPRPLHRGVSARHGEGIRACEKGRGIRALLQDEGDRHVRGDAREHHPPRGAGGVGRHHRRSAHPETAGDGREDHGFRAHRGSQRTSPRRRQGVGDQGDVPPRARSPFIPPRSKTPNRPSRF